MLILGLNIYHGDASACIIQDNKILIAIEEERINRIKHSSGFPINAIKYCLNYSKKKISDIDYVCINRDPKVNFFKKLLFLLKNNIEKEFFIDRFQKIRKITNLKKLFQQNFKSEELKFKLINVEHHLSHISSAFHFSGLKESAVLSIDGFGDFVSTMWGHADLSNIKIKHRTYFPHSLGIFYAAITQFLGFPNYGDEYKLMGLSSYGKDKYKKKLLKLFSTVGNDYKLNLKYYNHTSSKFKFDFSGVKPLIGNLFSKNVSEILGEPRKINEEITEYHKDIAKSAQNIYEEIFFDICNKIYETYQNENLCLSGGCAQNSVANGKILERTKFKNVYISSASGDAGGALGSASYFLSKKKIFLKKQLNSFYGPSFNNEEILKSIDSFKKKNNFENINQIQFNNEQEKNIYVAKKILNQKIVGWFQGPMEWGPRSLGNRAILANPAEKNIKSIINLKIKRRESFRPFAPSILENHVNDWFETNHPSYFMSFVFKVKKNKREIIPSVVHVDGTGRLQTVNKNTNLQFYNLINEFFKISKIPMLLNTSFNENEPIVTHPTHALDCFFRTNMDLLVLGDIALERN